MIETLTGLWFQAQWAIIDSGVLGATVLSPATGIGSGSVAAWVTHRLQSGRARTLPWLPSHAEALNHEDIPATRFFAAVHDMTMHVTEAWNTVGARASANSVEQVLDKEAFRETCEAVREAGRALLARLSDYQTSGRQTYRVLSELDGVWHYSSTDNYRTEFYTETTTDSDGKTRTETKTRQVYENTDHYFTYDAARAGRARSACQVLRDHGANRRWTTPGLARFRVGLDRIGEVDRMYLKRLVQTTILEDAEAEVTDEDIDGYLNQWLLGTRIDEQLTEHVHGIQTVFRRMDGLFRRIQASRANYHFRTTSRSHSGPDGYGAWEDLTNWLRTPARAWDAVEDMISTCDSTAHELIVWASAPEEIESDRSYAQAAIEAYELAFPDSTLELDQLVRHHWTVLAGLGTALLTGGTAYALHPGGLALLF